MMLRAGLVAIGMVAATIAFAEEDYEAIALEAKQLAPMQIEKYRDDAKKAYLQAEQLAQLSDVELTRTQPTAIQRNPPSTPTVSNSRSNPQNVVTVFISLSMPRQSIIAYLRDAKKIHASVVIRGLVNDSFKETFQTVSALVTEAGGGGIELNPTAFKQFHILSIPAVVVIPPGRVCVMQGICESSRDYDVMMGNIPLSAALKTIRDRGQSASYEAGKALQALQAGAYA